MDRDCGDSPRLEGEPINTQRSANQLARRRLEAMSDGEISDLFKTAMDIAHGRDLSPVDGMLLAMGLPVPDSEERRAHIERSLVAELFRIDHELAYRPETMPQPDEI
jgi:hypothetical protein